MLGKLIKHEFKDTAKLMLLIYALFTFITILGAIEIGITARAETISTTSEIMLAVMMVFYVLSIFALFIVTYVYISIHFYKTMFSSQGYLTHTLPVKSSTIFHVKLGVSLVWLLCSLALLMLSIFLFAIAASEGSILHLDPSVWTEISAEFESVFGAPLRSFAGPFFLCMLLGCLVFILMVYTSACIGQLFTKNKGAASIIAGVILYFIEQIVSSVLTLAGNAHYLLPVLFEDTDTSILTVEASAESDFIIHTFHISFVYSIIFVIAYYIACRVILRKHLNLE